MRVSCSHCRSQVEIGKDTQLSHIVCSACGKQFSLALEETATLGEPIVELPRPEAHSSDSGRYELLEPTEAGAASEVWKAKDTSTNRVVAVKFLRSAQSSVAQQQLLEWEASSRRKVERREITKGGK